MGCAILNIVILNEISTDEFRQSSISILMMFWGLFEIFVALIFYLVKDWKTIYIVFVIIPALIFNITNFYMTETPRFMVASQNHKGLILSLEKIAKVN